jgi:alanine racemase
MTINQRIDKLLVAIQKETACMDAILVDNGVTIREELSDEDEIMCWDGAFKARKYLQEQLARIESILHSCEQYIFVNCS